MHFIAHKELCKFNSTNIYWMPKLIPSAQISILAKTCKSKKGYNLHIGMITVGKHLMKLGKKFS